MHSHPHTDHSPETGNSNAVNRHLVLLFIAIVLLGGLYLLSQNPTIVGAGVVLFVLVHIVIAGGILLIARSLLGGLIQKFHGTGSASTGQEHAHTHSHDLETEGVTIGWARFYDLLVRFIMMGELRKLTGSILDLANIQPQEKVMDVGCGTGTLAIAAKQACPDAELHGIDAAPEMIARAQQKAQQAGVMVHFQPGLVEAIDAPDGTYDLLMNSLMVHHLPGDLKTTAFREMYRVLKPGGRLLIVDFEPPKRPLTRMFLRMLVGSGMMMIDNSQLSPQLEAAGFQQIHKGGTASSMAIHIAAIKPA